MDEKTRKELEDAHKKAMEGIKALNTSLKDVVDSAYDYTGVPKNAFKRGNK